METLSKKLGCPVVMFLVFQISQVWVGTPIADVELQAVFGLMENAITDNEMAEMNYQVESEGESPEDMPAI